MTVAADEVFGQLQQTNSGAQDMKVGLVGLGRMGAAIWQRLAECGCAVVAWDRSEKARAAQGKRGLRVLDGPRAVAAEADMVLSIITEDKGVRQVFEIGRASCRARGQS